MKQLSLIIIFLLSNLISSQNLSLTDVAINGVPVSNCGGVNFGANLTVDITFKVVITKQLSLVVDPASTLFVYYKTNSSGGPIFINGQIVSMINFTEGGSTTCILYMSGTMDASNIQSNGSILYAEYIYSYNPLTTIYSCSYPLSKPKFTFSPTSVTVGCASTSNFTFTIVPTNVPTGSTVYYVWNAGNGGWKNGTAVVTAPITTTSTSLTLTPALPTVLPANVSVTPYLNGVAQPEKTCSVSRAPLVTSATLSGNAVICTGANSIYTIAGLGAGNTVIWSSSNTAVATVSNATQSQVRVNGIANGVANLIATITNACGQTVTLTKSINIGAPVLAGNVIYGELWVRKSFYPQTLSFPAVSGAASYNWVITPDGDFPPSCPATGAAPAKFSNNLQTMTTTTPSVTASFGNCLGHYAVACTISNACGSTLAYVRYVTVGNSGSSPCLLDLAVSKTFTVLQNPIKNGEITLRKSTSTQIEDIDLGDNDPAPSIVDGDSPCYIEWPRQYNGLKANNQIINENSSLKVEVKIYDFYGELVYIKTVDTVVDEVTIKDSNLKSGKYVLHISDGVTTQKEIIIVE